jgi:hypothetical protein
LLPKKENKAGDRLQQLIEAAETVRGNIRYFSMAQNTVTAMATEVKDLRQNRAPATLRAMQERHPLQAMRFEYGCQVSMVRSRNASERNDPRAECGV